MSQNLEKNMADNVTGKLFIIIGPSGVGKTTLVEKVIEKFANQAEERTDFLGKVITYTTRKPRPGEIDCLDYYFISQDEFKKKEKENFFLETNYWCGHYYGSSKESIKDRALGKSYIMVLDITGARKIAQSDAHTIIIALIPKTMASLADRLRARGKQDESEIQTRITQAQQEIKELEASHLAH